MRLQPYATSLLLVLGLGCERPAPVPLDAGTSTSTEGPKPEPSWQHPKVQRKAMPLPERFRPFVPASPQQFYAMVHGLPGGPLGPPLSYIQSRLASGDPAMSEAFVEALSAASLGATRRDLSPYARLFRSLGPGLCDFLAKEVTSVIEGPGRELLWERFVFCDTPASQARADDPATPAKYRFQWYALHLGCREVSRPLEQTVKQTLEARQKELYPYAVDALARCGATKNHPLATRLVSLAEEADRPRYLARLEPIGEDDAECRRLPNPKTVTEDQLTKVNRCARLWSAHWAQARKLLRALPEPLTEVTYPPSRESIATLKAFDSAQARDAWLFESGLVEKGGGGALDPQILFLPALLEKAGRAFAWDPETGTFPNHHDEELYRLARLAGPELTDVIFSEDAPKGDAAVGPVHDVYGLPTQRRTDEGGYLLHAWASNERFTVSARALGDWQDTSAMVELLNAVLDARGSRLRFVAVDGDSQRAMVMVGPADALLAGAKKGLWGIVAGAKAVSAARVEERQAIERVLDAGSISRERVDPAILEARE